MLCFPLVVHFCHPPHTMCHVHKKSFLLQFQDALCKQTIMALWDPRDMKDKFHSSGLGNFTPIFLYQLVWTIILAGHKYLQLRAMEYIANGTNMSPNPSSFVSLFLGSFPTTPTIFSSQYAMTKAESCTKRQEEYI